MFSLTTIAQGSPCEESVSTIARCYVCANPGNMGMQNLDTETNSTCQYEQLIITLKLSFYLNKHFFLLGVCLIM